LKADGVFEGGGVKAIAFIGAICCMEEKGYKWQRTAGTSAGSIIAALLSVGYSGKEIREIMFGNDYRDFLSKKIMKPVPFIMKVINFLFCKGVYDAFVIEKYVGELLAAKGKTKFKHICTNGMEKLKIIATDITKKDMLILPDDLKKYNIDPMEFEIAKAVRMSCTLPFFFKPYKLNHNSKTSFVLDGGILSNFPVWIFDVEGVPRWPTFGFRLKEEVPEDKLQYRKDILAFTSDIFDTMINKNEMRYIRNKDLVRTIFLPCNGVKTTEFNISYNKCKMLYSNGYKATENFIKNWDFHRYVASHRVKNKSKKI
jgi:NTE family protein